MSSVGPIPEALEAIRRELVWVHARWKMNSQLFRSGEKRVALLNAYGGAFFASVQRTLVDDLVLGISRLLDPASMRAKTNHTLESLLTIIPSGSSSDQRALLAAELVLLRESCAPLLVHRNKRVAHRDAQVILSPSENPLPGLSYELLDQALDRVTAWVNGVERTACGSSMMYREFAFQAGGDANAVVYALKKAAVLDAQYDPHEARRLVEDSEYGNA
jgi:hypothetical protein